jgi:hypothetical protein
MNRSTRFGAALLAGIGVLLMASFALAQDKAGKKKDTDTSFPMIP